MFAFRFVAIGPFLVEIQQIPYLTLKNLGQGHDENRRKSNQVICRLGPTIVRKMKEIQKVVQKLSREQESAAGGGGNGGGPGGGLRTGTKNIKSPPLYRGDLISHVVLKKNTVICRQLRGRLRRHSIINNMKQVWIWQFVRHNHLHLTHGCCGSASAE